jgi:serine/threonine protein kinase
VASSLGYLHEYKPVSIIHCGLKPSNVLLDNDMVAHVADFGLARFLHQDTDISSGMGINEMIHWLCSYRCASNCYKFFLLLCMDGLNRKLNYSWYFNRVVLVK